MSEEREKREKKERREREKRETLPFTERERERPYHFDLLSLLEECENICWGLILYSTFDSLLRFQPKTPVLFDSSSTAQ